jgi:hypothetical protein
MAEESKTQKKKMLQELEARMPGMSNPAVRMALDRTIKQFKTTQNIVGRDKCRQMIQMQSLTQDQKDYIFLRMGWL